MRRLVCRIVTVICYLPKDDVCGRYNSALINLPNVQIMHLLYMFKAEDIFEHEILWRVLGCSLQKYSRRSGKKRKRAEQDAQCNSNAQSWVGVRLVGALDEPGDQSNDDDANSV
jgi:hypothetical protein